MERAEFGFPFALAGPRRGFSIEYQSRDHYAYRDSHCGWSLASLWANFGGWYVSTLHVFGYILPSICSDVCRITIVTRVRIFRPVDCRPVWMCLPLQCKSEVVWWVSFRPLPFLIISSKRICPCFLQGHRSNLLRMPASWNTVAKHPPRTMVKIYCANCARKLHCFPLTIANSIIGPHIWVVLWGISFCPISCSPRYCCCAFCPPLTRGCSNTSLLFYLFLEYRGLHHGFLQEFTQLRLVGCRWRQQTRWRWRTRNTTDAKTNWAWESHSFGDGRFCTVRSIKIATTLYSSLLACSDLLCALGCRGCTFNFNSWHVFCFLVGVIQFVESSRKCRTDAFMLTDSNICWIKCQTIPWKCFDLELSHRAHRSSVRRLFARSCVWDNLRGKERNKESKRHRGTERHREAQRGTERRRDKSWCYCNFKLEMNCVGDAFRYDIMLSQLHLAIHLHPTQFQVHGNCWHHHNSWRSTV
jgi:hypothetical protein